MNKLTNAINQINSNALAIVGIVLILAGLFDALVFCKSFSERKNVISKIEPNRLAASFKYQGHKELYPGYQQQLLASGTVPQTPWYIVAESDPTGLRLKTVVTR
jgi:hypothetical protein